MPSSEEEIHEQTSLLRPRVAQLSHRGGNGNDDYEESGNSIISSHLSKTEEAMLASATGERLPYNDYTTIDWLHDLVCLLQRLCISWHI